MNRDQLEHILRAPGAITGRTEWIIVGSQAILGAVADAPDEITVSEELDLYAPGDEYASDLIDGSIGERSPFHETFGYYFSPTMCERSSSTRLAASSSS